MAMRGTLTEQADAILTLRRAADRVRDAQRDFKGEVAKLKTRSVDQQREAAREQQESGAAEQEPLDISSMFPQQPINTRSPGAGIPSADLAQIAQALGPGAAASGGRGVQQVAGQNVPTMGPLDVQATQRTSVGSQIVRDQFGGFTTVRTPETQTEMQVRPNALSARDLVTLERVRAADTRAQARIAQAGEKLSEGVVDDYADGLGSLLYEMNSTRDPNQQRRLAESLVEMHGHISQRYGKETADRAVLRARAKSYDISRATDLDMTKLALQQRSGISTLLDERRTAEARGDKRAMDVTDAKILKETSVLGYRWDPATGDLEPIAAGVPKSFSTIARIQSRHNSTQLALTLVNTMMEKISEDPSLTGVSGSVVRGAATVKGLVDSLDNLTGGKATEWVQGTKALLYDHVAAGELPAETLGVLERLEDPSIAQSEAIETLLPYVLLEVLRSDRPTEQNVKAFSELSKITGLGAERAPQRLAVLKRLLERNESFTREQLARTGSSTIEQPTGTLELPETMRSVGPRPNTIRISPQPDGSLKLTYPDGRTEIVKGK
ncbi:MAG: hypothetical protein ACREQF_05835 [Candidatus Binataceae bacterium]